MGFDISVANKFHERQEDGELLEILHPVDETPTGWIVTIRSSESSKVLPYARKAVLEGFKTFRGEGGKASGNPEALAELGNRKVAAMIADWSGLTEGKDDVAYSQDRALKFVTEWPWFREQVEAFGDNRENFMKA